MRKVACPSCQASYDVDERRIPASGMKMRCPKCSASFLVMQDGSVGLAAPAVPAVAGAPAVPAPPAKPRLAPPPIEIDLPAPKPPKGATPQKPAMPSFDELDLPAPKQPKAPAAGGGSTDFDFSELDLPAPKSPSGPKVSPAEFDFSELDLPAPKSPAAGKPAMPSFDELDMPALKIPAPGKGAPSFDELDLPVPATRAKRPIAPAFDELDLPAPKSPKSPGGSVEVDPFGELDLPVAKGFEVDLPAPKLPTPPSAKRPLAPAVPDLPTPAQKKPLAPAVPDLPTPAQKKPLAPAVPDLPTPAQKKPLAPAFPELDLPAPKAAARGGGGFEFGELDLPKPASSVDLPAPVGSIDLPAPRASMPSLDLDKPRGAPKSDVFGELDLGIGPSEPPGFADDLALPAPRARRASKGDAYGELDLGASTEGDALEFGGLPGDGADDGLPGFDDAAAPIARDSMPPGLSIEERKAVAKQTRRQRLVRALVGTGSALVLAGGVGFGLKYTKYGAFGQYAIESVLPAAGSEASAATAIRAAELRAKSDTYVDVRAALAGLASARRNEGLNRALLARSLMHESLYLHRFGDDASSSTRANALAARLRERSNEAPGIDLALAAFALRGNEIPAAASALARARAAAPNDPYVDLIAGEISLVIGDAADASARFRASLAHGGGARAQWGLARALLVSRDAGADAALAATLEASPRHVEARTAVALQKLRAREIDAAATTAREAAGLDPVSGIALRSSKRSRAEALTVLGRIEEQRSHRQDARFAYETAADLDGGNVDALVGAGRVLLTESMAREALVRFDSAIASESTDPSMFATDEHPRSLVADARLGAIDALLLLDRPQDASAHAAQLLQALPEDASVVRAIGRVQHALHDEVAAEASFRRAIELEPTAFVGYLALSQLLFDLERPADAVAALASAEGKVQVTAEVRRLEGEAELRRGELTAARAKFQAALELDPRDAGSMFGLGVAFRREGAYADAARAFDQLGAIDASYPGLALERGQIFESQGQLDQAVAMFERAIRERPDDRELLVRLGGAQVAAGRLDDAQRTLDTALTAEPTNPLAIHYRGRLQLARGDIDAAIQSFQDSVRLETGRAEFHAYLATAYLEKSALSEAQTEITRTLELDERNVDGHLLRARLFARTGRVDAALEEASIAIGLDARRTEVWATVGECQALLGRRPQAIEAYRAAIAGDPNRGDWWARLARVQVETGDLGPAVDSYRRAVDLGTARTPVPTWTFEALRGLGDTALERHDAAAARAAYARYLEITPAGSPGRAEVQQSLDRLNR